MPNKLDNKIYDGYSYILYQEKENVIKVRCKYYQSHSCKGAGKINNDVFTLTEKHNHSAEFTLDKENELKRKLKEACQTQFRPTKEIYNHIINTQEDGLLLPWSLLETNMYRWHQNMMLPDVSSVNELSLILQNPKYEKLTHHQFGELKINFSSNFETIYLHDQDLFDKLFHDEQHNVLHFGSTEEIIPTEINITHSLACVIPNKNHSFSFGWAIIANESVENYNFFLEKIKTSSDYNRWDQTKIFYNFNNKLYNALTTTFNTAEIYGTFRAHCTIILQQIKLLNIEIDSTTQVIIRKLLSLSLLPPNKITNTFLEFFSQLPVEMFQKLQTILNYYFNNWIQTVGVEKYSFYNNWDSLKDCDYANWRQLASIKGINDNTWTLTRQLFNYTLQLHKNFDLLHDANRKSSISTPPLVRYNIKKKTIKRLWNLLDNEIIKEHDFLCMASSAIERFTNNLIFSYQFINPDVNFEIVQHHLIVPDNLPMILPCFNHDGHIEFQERIYSADQYKCVICFIRYVTHIFLPCRHAVICQQCLRSLGAAAAQRYNILNCPVCRTRSLRVDRIN